MNNFRHCVEPLNTIKDNNGRPIFVQNVALMVMLVAYYSATLWQVKWKMLCVTAGEVHTIAWRDVGTDTASPLKTSQAVPRLTTGRRNTPKLVKTDFAFKSHGVHDANVKDI